LTLKIYRPRIDKNEEKNIILGPRYNIGFLYEYSSNTELKITYIYSKKEGGNNYNEKLEQGLIITKINGTYINVDKGRTLEKFLTHYNLTKMKLTSKSGKNYYLDVELDGVRIGILTKIYWMPKNDLAKIVGSDFIDFLIRELIWLWIIAFSITLFNMLPLPIFDGDRVVKELVNWGVGEKYVKTKRKKERILYKKGETDYPLSEYRVEKVDSIKIIMKDQTRTGMGIEGQSEVLVSENKYTLKDSIGDGYKATVSFDFPEQTVLPENSLIEVSYEYLHDEKKRQKKLILNTIRIIALFILAANFILSFVLLGAVTFWI
jgi:hypothetical protein